MADSLAQVSENPEYQLAVKKLMGVSPAIRAIVSPQLINDKYMSELGKNQLELTKLGLVKQASKEDLAEKKREAENELAFKRDKLASQQDQFSSLLALDYAKNDLLGDKLALQKDIFGQQYGLESGLGLSTLRNYYDTRNSLADANNSLNSQQNLWSNVLGAANLGVGLYGLSKKNDYTNTLLSLLSKRGVIS